MIEDLLEYRGVSKLLSTYVDALPRLCDESGRIHTSYLQTGTATGRLSSRNPNLQNIPIRTDDGRMIRSAFVAGEGMHFLSADYSQIELVMLAHISGDEELTKAFYAVSEKLYSQAGAQGQPGPDMGGSCGNDCNNCGGDDNVVDADYEVVDDDNK